MLIFTIEREVSSVYGYNKVLSRSARPSYKLLSVLGVVSLLLFLFACLLV